MQDPDGEDMTFKVEKIKKPASIIFHDSTRLDGSFFVSKVSLNHPGMESIPELLSNDNNFLPFELMDGEVAILRKKNIVLIQLQQDEHFREHLYPRQIPVRMRLLSGKTMEGVVFSDLPENQSRLSDFLNASHGFFYLKADDLNFFVNAQYVMVMQSVTLG